MLGYIFAAFVIGVTVGGGIGAWVYTPEKPKYPIGNPVDLPFRIWGKDGQMLVEISCNTGNVTFGPSYDPDEAAARFWESIEHFRKAFHV